MSLLSHFKDTVEVYTKNTMKHADIEHANELAGLIRSTAKDCLNTTDFFNKYFELILRNCREKFIFGDFKNEVSTRPVPQDEIVPCSSSDLLKTFAGFVSNQTPFTVRNKADKDACTFSETGNLYEGLQILLNAVIDNIHSLQGYDDYIVFAAHYYMDGPTTHSGWVSVDKKNVVERYKSRREIFLGAEIWSYDSWIQRNITADMAEPTADLSPEHKQTRTILTGHHWAVFRAHPTMVGLVDSVLTYDTGELSSRCLKYRV